MHDLELVGTVSGMKCGLPFVALGDVHEVIGSAQVDLGVDIGGAETIE